MRGRVEVAHNHDNLTRCVWPCPLFEQPRTEPADNYRIDHYYSLQAGGEYEEGHIFCTIAEGERIQTQLRIGLPGVEVYVEPGGEYDYTTEQSDAETISASIIHDSGFALVKGN